MGSFAHHVFQPDNNGCLEQIDTVFASYDDPDEMRRSLINHDGYRSDIAVRCDGKVSPGTADLPDNL